MQEWAFCSLRWSGWAGEYYDELRARGKGHHTALRSPGNGWLNILLRCLDGGVSYDEEPHQTKRQRARGHLTAA